MKKGLFVLLMSLGFLVNAQEGIVHTLEFEGLKKTRASFLVSIFIKS